MFIFQGKDEVEISQTCKLCMAEIKFTITSKEFQEIESFPIKKSSVHGDPKHNLIVYINKNLEIENFSIEDVLDKSISYSAELTRKVLSDLALNAEEIDLYFKTTGKGTISLGEISLLVEKDKEESEKIARKFIEKGLYKEIIGATPHYVALPPYAALLMQLRDFQKYIQQIHDSVPTQLEDSFSKIEKKAEAALQLDKHNNEMIELKNEMLSRMVQQKKELDVNIEEVDKMRNITEIIANFENLIKKAIDNQLALISKKKIRDELDRFYKRFMLHLKELLESARTDVDKIIESTENSMREIKKIFSEISKNFSTTLMSSESQLTQISENISESFSSLKELFTNNVIKTFGDLLTDIIKRLEISQITTEEFWEQAKQASLFTMKDIWFIKSAEDIKSQIKDEMNKAKIRLLIVAPSLTDIDIGAVMACPSHVNVRIAANIDLNHGGHQYMYNKLKEMPNVQMRHNRNQNLWGINRDSEVVIVSFVKKIDGENIDLAGLGSSTPEHIRILIPVLEDGWRSASKQVES